jgi:hypothetical protein
MNRFVLCFALGAAVASLAPIAVRANEKVVVAPADEYFGKMKMSILGIRNEIHDLTLKIGYEPAKAESFLSMATMTEDAMNEWERKYPKDPWIPKSLFSLERMYSIVHWSNEFNVRAKRVMTYLHVHYATTWYGREAAKELAAGSVGKYVPLASIAVDPPTMTGNSAPTSSEAR